MKTILRNLFYTLKRFRTASVLNLLGLSTAFAAFMLIMMKASYEYNFDTCYPDSDRLVMLNFGEKKDNLITLLPRGPIDFLIQQVPGIEYGTIYAPCWQKQAFCTNPENPQYFYETPWAVYPDFGKVIGLQFVEGSDKDMNKPESIIISESYARKLFPKGNALGSYLYTEGDNGLVKGIDKFRICGIFKDLPENCQFKNDMFIRMSDYQKDDWASQNYFAFFRLKPRVSAADINQQIEASGANKRLNIVDKGNQRLYVFPIKKLYYDMSASYYLKTGDRSTMVLIVSIGLLIIIIACINLINFSTALAPVRIRSINTQKVLGSSNWELRRALLTESVGTVLISWLVSLSIVEMLIRLKVLSFMGFTPSLITYWHIIGYTGIIALVTGIIAGLYPSWYMTSFSPALVLKGNYALSGRGKRLRMSLIGFQYIISFVLIVTAGFIFLQNRYMQNYTSGIDKDQILVASLPQMPYQSSEYRNFTNTLKSFAEIDDIAYAKSNLGGGSGYTQYAFLYKGEMHGHYYIDVTANFCKVMGLKIVSGEDFLPSDSIYHSDLNFIATQDLQQQTGIPAGEILDFFVWGVNARLKGYVNNVQLTSLRSEALPYIFCPNGKYGSDILPFAYIRVKAGSNMRTALKHIRQTLAKCFIGYPVEVKFYDQVYSQLYQKEAEQQRMITLFSLLAILISLVGVFGLIIFEAEQRRKEIGIRKVYGAHTHQILWIFGQSYLTLSIVSSIIATPIAWYIVSRWLEQFTERIDITPWMFILTCIIISLINFSTALTPMRIRSINTQKVLGSPVNQLRIGLVSETIAIVLIGWLLSLFIVWILTHMKLLSLIGFTPSFFTYLPVILISGGIALLTGIIAGLYPAWYMTSFPPALMLKGNYALSAKGRLFRTLLTSFQYIISFALLVCATFIWQQNQYMKIQDTGFARDEIVIAGLPHKGQELSQFTTFKHELEKFPEFKGTAYVSTKLGASDVYSMTGSKYEGEEFYHYEIRVSPDFGEVMGFKLLEGRFFLASDTISSNKYTYCLGTKRIKDEQHIPTDTPFRGNHSKSNYIVGYIDDVIFTSSRVNAFAYSPFLFTVESQLTKLPYAYIRIKAGSDVSTALRHIHETAEKIFPGYPVEVNFFNTYYQQLYEKETNQQYMVTLFSLLAIIISLVGVFGLTIFETAYRRKEIGIRKVYGAKTSDILWNFNRTYLRIITICSIIASPFAWFFMDKWLQNFIIRINLSPWVFLIAFAIIIILTLTIVTIQNYRAATSNPTENLKIE